RPMPLSSWASITSSMPNARSMTAVPALPSVWARRRRACGSTMTNERASALGLDDAAAGIVSLVARALGPANTSLCRLLQVDYQVLSVSRIGQTGVRHTVADDDPLWIGDERVKGLRRPGDATAFHGC